jgi:proline dehydrogenase
MRVVCLQPRMATIADVLNNSPNLQRRLFFLARRFVAGETVDSAMAAVARLNANDLSATVDFLGEDVREESEAARTAQTYLEMIDRIVAAGADCNVSVKLSAIGQAFSEDVAFENLRRIIGRARPSNMFIRLDMEGSATVDSTYRIFERARAIYEHIGPVVQAYLHRAAADVERCIQLGVRVRLCKGAYREPPAVALQKMSDIRANYLKLAERLLANGKYPGIATHDEGLIRAVQQFAKSNAIAQDRFEFQMLYGVRSRRQRALRAEGYRMRVYVPFGTHWAGYFYRRVTERKENVFLALRGIFGG